MLLYFILDLPADRPLAWLAALLPRMAAGWGALDVVQVRAQACPARDHVAALRQVRESWEGRPQDPPKVRRGGAGLERDAAGSRPLLLANDRADVALAAGADGVHVGEEDLAPEAIRELAVPAGFVVGLTCRTARELRAALGRPVDYVGVGPFHPSRTKPESAGDPRGALHELNGGYPLPVVAIGGITPATLEEVASTPLVRGVAVSAAVQAATDPGRAALALRTRLDRVAAGG